LNFTDALLDLAFHFLGLDASDLTHDYLHGALDLVLGAFSAILVHG